MDCTFINQKGKFNYRVGAVIANGRKILMAKNPQEKRDFYYSVGGISPNANICIGDAYI